MASASAARATEAPASPPQGITYIPLNKLLLSSRNVRHDNADEDIDSLAEDIAARGLIHNLVATQAPGGKGFYEVDAGGRRLRALHKLVDQRTLSRAWPVPCRIEPREQATETSLAENIHRVAMTPADEAVAFQTVIAGYASGNIRAVVDGAEAFLTEPDEQVAHCARRFGVTERHVRQRLRLAALAREIFVALRAGTISLDAAKAYTSVSDPAVQLKVFKAEEKRSGHRAADIRAALTGKLYDTDHKAVRYIGLDAYIAAGGRLEQDLFFGTEDRAVLLDPAIVDKLVGEKTGAEAQQLAQAAGYLDGVVKPWNGVDWAEPKAPPEYQRKWGAADSLSAEQRAEALTGFELGQDENGSVTLQPYRYATVWVKPQPAPLASPNALADNLEAIQRREAEEERQDRIRYRAARLAVKALDTDTFEKSSFFPIGEDFLPPFNDLGDGTCIVAVLVRVPAEEIEARLAEAEARLAQEDAELEEEEAAETRAAAATELEPAE